MWLLKDSNGKTIYLKTKEVFTVGRKTGRLVVSDDSVSRNHAAITITTNKNITQIENNTEPLSICKINDLGSKYGSYILRGDDSELRVTARFNSLQHMDKIRFGVQSSIFTVMYVPIITATSGLDKNEKNELREIIDTIDGIITQGWEASCTHMTISKPNISEKLTCALASGVPIVPMDFWRGVLRAFEANEKLPNFEEFTNYIDSKLGLLGNVSVRSDPRRKTLFQNLTFLHYDSGQYNVHRRMIESAGGTPVLWRHREQKDIDVCDDNVIVVQLIESNTTQATGTGDANYMAVCEQLGKCGRRAIPSSEIALAIFRSSTKKCCNPKYDHAGMFKKSHHRGLEASSILAPETQDVDIQPASPPTGKSLPSDVFIKESVEQATKVDSQIAESIPKETRDNVAARDSSQTVNPPKIEVNILDDCASQFDEASMKVASLNYERYATNESYVDTEIKTNPMKRGREENDDNRNKRIRGTIWENCNKEKEATSEKTDAGYPDANRDSIQKKLSDLNLEKQKTKASLVASQAGESDTAGISTSMSEDQTPLRDKDHGERVEPFLSRDNAKVPLKRNKTTRSSPTKKSKLLATPEPGQSTLTKFLSPRKNVAETVESTLPKKCGIQTLNVTTSAADAPSNSRSSYKTKSYERILDPNTSVQPLLRTESPTRSSARSTTKFGKNFRKSYTTNLRRIELNELVNARSWSKDKSFSNYSLSTEQDIKISPRKISPLSSKKMFRV